MSHSFKSDSQLCAVSKVLFLKLEVLDLIFYEQYMMCFVYFEVENEILDKRLPCIYLFSLWRPTKGAIKQKNSCKPEISPYKKKNTYLKKNI